MFCMKCGKEIEEKAVFCDTCLQEMAKYPVKPDVKIFLPRSNAPSAVKKSAPRRRTVSVEERMARMKKNIQLLSVVLAVTLLALVLSVALLVESISSEAPQEAIGQNYGTIEQEK